MPFENLSWGTENSSIAPKNTLSLYLMKEDKPLIQFDYNRDDEANLFSNIKLLSEIAELPYELQRDELSGSTLYYFVSNRIVQSNRKHLKDILKVFKLDTSNPMEILLQNHGLSLNDLYWFKEVGDTETFNNINLYDNSFDMSISNLFLIGKGDASSVAGKVSSPEFTTDGMLAKGWRKIDKDLCLLKVGSSFGGTDNREPLSEVLASIIATQLGLEHVDYTWQVYHDRLCSSCKLFTSKEFSHVPYSALIYASKADAPNLIGGVFDLVLKSKFIDNGHRLSIIHQLEQMVIFDAIIENRDRHFKNFGFLVDNKTNKIISLSPIYDNGMSLFFNSTLGNLENIDLNSYHADLSMLYGFKNTSFLTVCSKSTISEILVKLKDLNQNTEVLDDMYFTIEKYFDVYSKDSVDKQDYIDTYFNCVAGLLKVREKTLEACL